VDWTFLGGSIANWSFVAFVAMAVWMLLVLLTKLRTVTAANDDAY
jgi:disulfide bond formation protein DsbB